MIRVALEPRRLVVGQQAEMAVRLTNVGAGACRNIVFKLRLPLSILLLRGSDRIELSELTAGESVTHVIQVRPKTMGTWTVSSVNFSYRDHDGLSHRDNGFTAELTVTAAVVVAEEPAPEFTVDLLDTVLPYQEWTMARCRIVNTGRVALRQSAVSLSGPIDVDNDNQVLDELAPGGRMEFSYYVRARAIGDQVPVRLTTSYTDAKGVRGSHSRTLAVQVHKQSATVRVDRATDLVRILYLAANPTDLVRVLWDRELREIRGTIRAGEHRDRVDLRSQTAARAKDIGQALLDNDPRIVHFSGHGMDGGICVENDQGGTQLMSSARLAAVLGATTKRVECVIVNACDTEDLARTLATSIDYVIGMRHWLTDREAIDFSIGFYMALAANRPIDDAYKLGCALIDSPDATDPLPILFRRGRA